LARVLIRQSPPSDGALHVTYGESILLGAEEASSKPRLQRSPPTKDLKPPFIIPGAATTKEASVTAYTNGLARVSVSSKWIFKETDSEI